jgi:hypothetical protein
MHQREERERRVGLLLFRENEGEREDFGETVRQFLEEWREFLSHGICGQRGDRVERRFCLHRRKLCAEGAKESVLCTVYERESVCVLTLYLIMRESGNRNSLDICTWYSHAANLHAAKS